MSEENHSAALAGHLAGLIAADGPLTVEQWMGWVLGHPEHGYYMTGDPFGLEGDFITAPEVSQMFGEMLGLWCAQTWAQMGAPDQVQLVELGPGRGTLMADALRAAKALPGFAEALNVHLVETSPHLRSLQRAALKDHDVTWHEAFESVPEGPLIAVTNELFDALPIRQFERQRAGWHERLIDIAPGGNEPPGFRFVLSAGLAPAAALLPRAMREAPIGGIAEICPAGLRLAAALGSRVVEQGGAALIIDYGYAESRPGDTLQAVLGHKTHPVLDSPGLADVCAHVNFEHIGISAGETGARVSRAVEQGGFLLALGIEARAAMLRQNADEKTSEDIAAAFERLTGPGAMGNLFKVMSLAHPELGPLAGFE